MESIKSGAEIAKMCFKSRDKTPTRRKSKTKEAGSPEVAITKVQANCILLTLWVFFVLTALISGLYG